MITLTREQIMTLAEILDEDKSLNQVEVTTDANGKLRASVIEIRPVKRQISLTRRPGKKNAPSNEAVAIG